jgi:threonine dehydrogenase-like Zn-dependent dehydrogenase
MNVVASGRIDLRPMVTNRFALDQIEQAPRFVLESA